MIQTNKIFIGVDPGLEGATAIIYPDHINLYPIEFSGNKVLIGWMGGFATKIIYIENVWKPVSLVRLAGIIEGECLMTVWEGDIVERVSPSTWRKTVLGNYRATKQDAIEYCKEKYPDVSLLRTKDSRVDNHNFAEALCIARYAQIMHI